MVRPSRRIVRRVLTGVSTVPAETAGAGPTLPPVIAAVLKPTGEVVLSASG
jgi:hypothetical protein